MSVAYLNSRIESRAMLAAAVESTLNKCAEKGEEPNAEQRSQLASWGDEIKTLDAEIAQLRTALDANEKFTQTVDRVAEVKERQERRESQRRDEPQQEVELRLSDAFVQSEAFTEYRMRGTSDRFVVNDFFRLEERTTLETANTFPPKQRWDGLPGPAFVTPFLDLINHERVSTGAFDFVKWPQATGIAVVAEKLAKPEVTLAPTLETLSLETYAGWVQVTRQALEDQPRIRSQVELRLRQALAKALEAGAVAELPGPEAGDGADLEGIRAASAGIQAAGYRPNAVAMNPMDAGLIDVTVMGHTVDGPVTTRSLWGLPVVPVASITPGLAYVADWTQAVTWFDRGSTDIYLSDSHADLFIKNMFVILAEARAAFAVTDASAIATVNITQPTLPPLAARASKS